MIEIEYDDIMLMMFYAQLGVSKLPKDSQHEGWVNIHKFVDKYLVEFADD